MRTRCLTCTSRSCLGENQSCISKVFLSSNFYNMCRTGFILSPWETPAPSSSSPTSQPLL